MIAAVTRAQQLRDALRNLQYHAARADKAATALARHLQECDQAEPKQEPDKRECERLTAEALAQVELIQNWNAALQAVKEEA